MANQSKSRYEELLLELGFERYEEPEPAPSMKAVFVGGTDEPPRERIVPPELPCFIGVTGALEFTMAVDELEQKWVCPGVYIDMSVHGFHELLRFVPLN